MTRRSALLAIVALATACTVHQTDVPSLTGPSEFALSVTVAAQPDIITRDGFSQSTIVITARDDKGAPKSGMTFRVDTMVSGVRTDFGTLSSRSVTTLSDGRVTLTYTSPTMPPAGAAVVTELVTIVVVPVNYNYQTANSQTADIRLVLPITIGENTPIAQFTFAPTTPAKLQKVNFDASSSTAPAGHKLVRYSWNWGDGEIETGSVSFEEHDFATAGTFIVVLTVTDDTGVSSSISTPITVTDT